MIKIFYFYFQDIVYKSSLPVYRFLRVFGIFPYSRDEPGRAELILKSKITIYAGVVFTIFAVMFCSIRILCDLQFFFVEQLKKVKLFFSDVRLFYCPQSRSYYSIARRTFRRIGHRLFILIECFTNSHHSNDVDRNP